jgi:ABC-2 type transport system ATP-binding protein
VFGHDVVREADAVRGRVSLTGQFASIDDDLTGRENLILLARLLGHSRPRARQRARLDEVFLALTGRPTAGASTEEAA